VFDMDCASWLFQLTDYLQYAREWKIFGSYY
jgi:hypothetical protein